MKRTIIALAAASLAWTALAVEKAELDQKARKLVAKFEKMQQKPDKRIPAETLRKAEGIILLDRTKAGFIFAYQGGAGAAMVKDKKSGKWSPIAFMKADEASLGFQVGGQQSFLVILLMNSEGTQLLTDPTIEIGGEARGTAGDKSAGVEETASSAPRPVLVYDDRKGLFGGAALKGGALAPDEEGNGAYYGNPLTIKQILFEKKAQPTEVAVALATKIALYSKK